VVERRESRHDVEVLGGQIGVHRVAMSDRHLRGRQLSKRFARSPGFRAPALVLAALLLLLPMPSLLSPVVTPALAWPSTGRWCSSRCGWPCGSVAAASGTTVTPWRCARPTILTSVRSAASVQLLSGSAGRWSRSPQRSTGRPANG
jgi:hypothetical protein